MYMIWHKKLGLVKFLKYRWQVWLWLLKYGKDENIEIINTNKKKKKKKKEKKNYDYSNQK